MDASMDARKDRKKPCSTMIKRALFKRVWTQEWTQNILCRSEKTKKYLKELGDYSTIYIWNPMFQLFLRMC